MRIYPFHNKHKYVLFTLCTSISVLSLSHISDTVHATPTVMSYSIKQDTSSLGISTLQQTLPLPHTRNSISDTHVRTIPHKSSNFLGTIVAGLHNLIHGVSHIVSSAFHAIGNVVKNIISPPIQHLTQNLDTSIDHSLSDNLFQPIGSLIQGIGHFIGGIFHSIANTAYWLYAAIIDFPGVYGPQSGISEYHASLAEEMADCNNRTGNTLAECRYDAQFDAVEEGRGTASLSDFDALPFTILPALIAYNIGEHSDSIGQFLGYPPANPSIQPNDDPYYPFADEDDPRYPYNDDEYYPDPSVKTAQSTTTLINNTKNSSITPSIITPPPVSLLG